MTLGYIGSQLGKGDEMLLFEWKDVDVEFLIDRLHHLLSTFPPSGVEAVVVIAHDHLHDRGRADVELGIWFNKRLIDIKPTAKTVDALSKIDLPAGVDIDIKLY